MFNVFFFLMSQLDLENPKRITGIITQGAKDFGVVQFVSAFKLAYSDDGQTWSIVKDQIRRTDKVKVMTYFKYTLLLNHYIVFIFFFFLKKRICLINKDTLN